MLYTYVCLGSALRLYIPPDLLDGHVVSLGRVRSTQAWGFEDRNFDTLYRGPHPFVFYMPGSVKYITFEHRGNGLYRLELDVLPLALPDIVGLDIIANFGTPVAGTPFRMICIFVV